MNKLLRQALGQHRATLRDAEGGGFSVITASNRHVGVLPANPDPFDPEQIKDLPLWSTAVLLSLTVLIDLDNQSVTVGQDQRLSAYGRTQALGPANRQGAVTLAGLYASLVALNEHLVAEERARYSVPQLGPNDVRGELRDGEARNGLRALGTNERTEVLKQLADGEDESLLAAVLRSPVRLAELEKTARAGWIARVDRLDPEGLAQLQLKQRSLAWAMSVIRTIAAVLMPSLGLSREELFKVTRSQAGHKLWGFAANEVAIFERKLQSVA